MTDIGDEWPKLSVLKREFYVVGPRAFESLDEAAVDMARKQRTFTEASGLYWFVALSSRYPQEPVGVGAVDPDKLTMGSAFVAEGWRGHGVQRKLIEVRQKWAAAEGKPRLTARVDFGNDASLRNMLNSGFRTRQFHWLDCEIELIWNCPPTEDDQ